MSEEGTAIVGEAEGHSLSPQKHAEVVASKAREKGWRPLEEWEGDPEDWVDAKEFVGRTKLYDRINDLKGTLTKQRQEFQSDMKLVVSNMAKIRDAEYKRALKDLESKREQALEDDDARAAVKVSKEIETLEKERAEEAASVKQAAATTAGPTPEFLEWQEKNSWFTSDKEMREDAISIGVGYAAGNPNLSQTEVLNYVTKKIKRMYSDQFEPKEKRQVTNKVEGAQGTSQKQVDSNQRGKKLTLADLPEEYRTVAKTLIKRGVFKEQAAKNKRSEEEEYIAQYQENA
jgi:hypothetical protein